MGKLFKYLFVLTMLAAGFAAYSYLGARFSAGRLLGNNTPLSGRHIVFNFQGVPGVPGNPKAWVFSYSRSRLPGVTSAQIIISYNGRVIATRPPDLSARVDAWERTRLP